MLRVIPLGGLGEVGLNCLVLEHGDERLLVDCGLMFPRAGTPGVEVVVPDFTWLRERPQALTGIVLTHAHEDHLGALQYLLRDVQVPVYGTPFTVALARHRLDEAGVEADLRVVGPLERFAVGTQFDVEPVRVAHSVPDAVGLVVRTRSGTLVHTGDFKLDGMPVDGQLTDLDRLGAVGEEGVAVLLSDSTNSENAGTTGSERLVAETFERLFARAPGRIVIAMFGSHLHRVRHVLDLAQKVGRRVLLAGRSLQRNVELARQVQLMDVPEALLVAWDSVSSVPPEKLVVLCTGAQAEPRSALMQLLSPEPGALRLRADDLVILSSRTIPGNEPGVSAMVNRILAKGAQVITTALEPGIHVSGHASRDEQQRVLQTVRPRNFIPVHGELRHLKRHHALAESCGVPGLRSFVITDGEVLGFAPEGVTALGRVPVGQLMMRREGLLPIGDATLAERRALAEAGVVIAVVVLQQGGGRVLSPTTVHGQGLEAEELAALPLASAGAQLAVDELSAAVRGDDERVREALVRGVRRVFKQTLGRRPQVLPVVVRL